MREGVIATKCGSARLGHGSKLRRALVLLGVAVTLVIGGTASANDGAIATATEMQLMQNKMMMSRIKYQALAVLVVAVLLAMSR